MIAGFTDQSHMTRQFHSTYGMPPARWGEDARALNALNQRASAAARQSADRS
jgi:AraC-like DNA-binding protein